MSKTNNPDAFVSKWRTTVANESITIPTAGNGYNYSIDCGAGGAIKDKQYCW